jgi:hypothetical protein
MSQTTRRVLRSRWPLITGSCSVQWICAWPARGQNSEIKTTQPSGQRQYPFDLISDTTAVRLEIDHL